MKQDKILSNLIVDTKPSKILRHFILISAFYPHFSFRLNRHSVSVFYPDPLSPIQISKPSFTFSKPVIARISKFHLPLSLGLCSENTAWHISHTQRYISILSSQILALVMQICLQHDVCPYFLIHAKK